MKPLPNCSAGWMSVWQVSDLGSAQVSPGACRDDLPGQCGSLAQLQRRLDEADALQRDAYPYVGQRSRSEAWPLVSR